MLKRAFNTKEASTYTGLSVSYLNHARVDEGAKKPAPPFIKIGERILYLREDLDNFLDGFKSEQGVGS